MVTGSILSVHAPKNFIPSITIFTWPALNARSTGSIPIGPLLIRLTPSIFDKISSVLERLEDW